MNNNFNQIPLFKVFMSPNIDKPLLEVLHSGFIGEGESVKLFEKNLISYFKNSNLATVNSGTSALHLAYHLALYPKHKSYKTNCESEIISSPMTCTATNTPIINNQAKIVWADCDPNTGNIDPDSIRKKITKKTKAIVMIHWGGNPCLINEINNIAKEYGIKTIEDCAHAIGAEYYGNVIGNTVSDFSCFSFQAIKHITSVDGGLITCKSFKDFERIKLLRWFGIDREPKNKEAIDLRCEIDVPEAGYKFHMNNISAVIGNENFKHLDEIIQKHRENAMFYNNIFSQSGIKFAKENSKSSYWLYTIHVENRDELMIKLKEFGIQSSKVHARNDTHSMFKDFKDQNLTGVEDFNRTHLCIPVGWWLSSEDREFIAKKIIEFAK
jgi:dTDP-4-amino-4,6-dideoxygalactose transaminase